MKLLNPSCLLIFLFFGSVLTAQNQEASRLFDELVALENTDLASGTEYIELHIIRNNRHKYFQADKFATGQVSYEGQVFTDIPMKYNIYDDLLLINLVNSGGETTIQLHKEKIESFRLYGHDFINLQLPEDQESEIEGFYEVLYETPSGLLLKKHVQKILKHLDRNFTYYEFEPDDPEYVFFQDTVYTPFDSRRDLTKLFPEREKEIRQFYRSHRSLSRSDHDQFLINLFKNIQGPASQN